jgi:glyoxylase-like metal-dependent hydrolase (beta-lactamase superfamily II)
MFGVVPRVLWSQKAPPDDKNRISLATRPLLVRGVRTLLIDAGIGDKEDERFREMYAVERARNLDHALAEAGVTPEDIDIVLATHLHWDHVGGFTMRDTSGR